MRACEKTWMHTDFVLIKKEIFMNTKMIMRMSMTALEVAVIMMLQVLATLLFTTN